METKVAKKKKYYVEGARLTFKNFSGKEKMFNEEGKRNFCLLLSPDMAYELEQDGFNVKELKPKEEGDPVEKYVQVQVSYAVAGPKVMLYSGRSETELDQDSINILDFADITNIDLSFVPYRWSFKSKSGISAYLHEMHVTIEPDPLAEKYRRPRNED